MAFQVTVIQPFTSHSKTIGAEDHCKLWQQFCFGAAPQKPMEIYWIIPKECVGVPKNFKDRVVIIEELDAVDFPALKGLVLQKKKN